jgi:hypothetical protein
VQRARTEQRFIIVLRLAELEVLDDANTFRELIISKVCQGAAAAIQ